MVWVLGFWTWVWACILGPCPPKATNMYAHFDVDTKWGVLTVVQAPFLDKDKRPA